MIKISNVTKRFGATVALANVSAEFLPGEIHCLLGENGAGKSTIGKIIGGLHQPDEGALLVDGKDTRLANPKAARNLGLAMCYQELSLAKHLSVRANLCLGSERSGTPFSVIGKSAERVDVQAVLEKLGLDIDTEIAVGELPVAQQQLLEIGKAIMQKPRVVVFDEPTAMLGAVEKKKFLSVLRQLKDEGVAAILITHHIEDVMEVADRITVMRNGTVAASFPMDADVTEDLVVERLTGKRRDSLTLERRTHAPTGAPALQIRNLGNRQGKTRTLSIHPGQIVSLYGVVGCGAEKLIAALAGQGKPNGIDFELSGHRYKPSSGVQAARAGVSYLPAGRVANCIFPTRSIAENLTFNQIGSFGRFGFISKRREAEYAAATLRDAGVKFADATLPITSLSGGNQQKVLLARAMSSARVLLLLEEPTAGVDIDAKAQIHHRIREAVDAGLAVLMVSSDLEETISLSDTVYTMYDSEIAGCYEFPTIDDQPNIVADVLGQRTSKNSEAQLNISEV